MKLVSEDQLLEIGFRAQVIQEINTTENEDRRNRALRKYEVYRDKTKQWVLDALSNEFSPSTVEKMQGRVSNVSICRRIIDKLAQSYTGGVTRLVDEDEQSTEAIERLSEEMDIDRKLKQADRYLELFKQTPIFIKPERAARESTPDAPKFALKARALEGFNYDVIEDAHDQEQPRVVILSEHTRRTVPFSMSPPQGSDGRDVAGRGLLDPTQPHTNRKDDIIADSRQDAGLPKNQYIWWSDKYHFTTDEDGKIIEELSPEDLLNPIQMLPFVNLAENQDGKFWADGGDDIVDGSILINVILTDTINTAMLQGYGQAVMKGKNLDEKTVGGPHHVVKLEYDGQAGDTEPTFEYVSANPPLESLMKMVEQYAALLLTTNNLAPTHVSGNLNAQFFSSGVERLIATSESTASLEDRQKLFKDSEPVVWEVIRRWQNLYFERGLLSQAFNDIGQFQSSDVKLKFARTKPVITEQEKLAALEKRKELGLNTMVELVKLDDPELTEEEAAEKLKEIMKEKMERMLMVASNAQRQGEDDQNDQDIQDKEDSEDVEDGEVKV